MPMGHLQNSCCLFWSRRSVGLRAVERRCLRPNRCQRGVKLLHIARGFIGDREQQRALILGVDAPAADVNRRARCERVERCEGPAFALHRHANGAPRAAQRFCCVNKAQRPARGVAGLGGVERLEQPRRKGGAVIVGKNDRARSVVERT